MKEDNKLRLRKKKLSMLKTSRDKFLLKEIKRQAFGEKLSFENY